MDPGTCETLRSVNSGKCGLGNGVDFWTGGLGKL